MFFNEFEKKGNVYFRDLGRPKVLVGDMFGAIQIILPELPFKTKSFQRSANIGKLFIIRLLELMNASGYDFQFSSDLSRWKDQSSLFFKKSPNANRGRPWKRIVCVAPGNSDRLILMNHDQQVIDAVQSAITNTWQPGVQDFNEGMHENITFHEFKLHGNPWFSEQDESVEARKLLLDIIKRMAVIGYRFHANVNIKVNFS